jgi:hypothetical protein
MPRVRMQNDTPGKLRILRRAPVTHPSLIGELRKAVKS